MCLHDGRGTDPQKNGIQCKEEKKSLADVMMEIPVFYSVIEPVFSWIMGGISWRAKDDKDDNPLNVMG